MRLPDETTPTALEAILDLPIRRVAARAVVLDRDENPIGSVVPISAGSVNVDAGAAVTRSADLTAIDPRRALAFDSGSPGAGSLYADRFVQVDYGIADAAGVVRWTPIFRGPVIRFERSHPEVRISAQGKESLGLAPNLPLFKGSAINIGKGKRVDEALAQIAARMGEASRRIRIPQIGARVGGKGISLGRTAEPWKALRTLAGDHGYQAFYTGDGTLVVRKVPPRPVWTFDAELLTFPVVTYDLGGEFRNVVRVVGKTPAGKKTPPPSYTAEPPNADPLSPRSLAHNGVARCVAEYVEVETSNAKTVRGIAEAELGRRMKQSVTVGFDALTVPGLEEADPCAVILPGSGEAFSFTAATFSIGLGVDDMSIGATTKVRLRRLDK